MLDAYHVLGALVFLIMMTVLVAAHEYGHYLFARLFGMEVEAFALMVGGVRKTDLRQYLERPLVSGWVVAAVMGALILAWDLTTRFATSLSFDVQPLLLALQVGVVLVVPLWIASRLAALYHANFVNVAKWFVISWLGWFFAAGAFGITKNLGVTGLIPLLAPVSALALIFTYYMPVGSRQEEENYGHGQIKVDGELVPVRFRPVISKVSKSGTEFSLLLLPFGGFAKIKGMQPRDDGSEVSVPGGFFNKAPWKRFLVLLAGPLFSVLAGAVLLAGLYATSGMEKLIKEPVLGPIQKDSAAEKAGLKEGDKVVKVDGKPIDSFYQMRGVVAGSGGKTLKFEVRRGDEVLVKDVALAKPTQETPVVDPEGLPTGDMRYQAKIGASPAYVKERLPLGKALVEGIRQPILGVAMLAQKLTSPAQLKDDVGGIALVAAATDSAVRSEEGLENVIQLAAMLSISLGIFNLLPIYPLDGGQMLVALAEMFRGGRRLSLRVQNAFSTVGFALICMLVLFVLVNDTKRLSGADKEAPAQSTAPPKSTTKPSEPTPGVESP